MTSVAVVAAHDWSPGARLVLAGAALPALPALLGLALAGGRNGGRGLSGGRGSPA